MDEIKEKNPEMKETANGGYSFVAALCLILASLCFSIGGLLIKMIPWSALAINGARNLIGSCVIGIYLLCTRHRVVFNRTVLTGALSLIGVTALFTLANKMTTAANAIVLQFTAPAFVILLMFILYGKKPAKIDIAACAAVFFGVCLFFVDGFRAGNQLGNLLAVISGICYAGVFMMNTGKGADAISSCFLGQLAAGVIFSPLMFRETDFSLQTLLPVLVLGVIQVGVSYILLSYGIKKTPPAAACLITGMEPILNPVWVALFCGETLSPLSVIGGVIVVGSICAYNVLIAGRGKGEQAIGNRQ